MGYDGNHSGTISTITGLGFLINPEQWSLYEHCLSSQYGVIYYSKRSEDVRINHQISVFIYVKETIDLQSDDQCYHDNLFQTTTVTSNPKMIESFTEMTEIMRQRFHLNKGVISYYMIHTSLGFGEIVDWHL